MSRQHEWDIIATQFVAAISGGSFDKEKVWIAIASGHRSWQLNIWKVIGSHYDPINCGFVSDNYRVDHLVVV